MKSLKAALALLALAATAAFAEPPAFLLQAVSIKTASGQVITGYSRYAAGDAARKSKKKAEPPSPDALRNILLADAKKPSGLWFLPEAYRVSHPKVMLVTTAEPWFIPSAQVVDVRPVGDPLNGFAWHGVVSRVKAADLELLKKEPVYQCHSPPQECCSIDYWLSYDETVGPAALDPVCKEDRKGFELPDVVHVEEATE